MLDVVQGVRQKEVACLSWRRWVQELRRGGPADRSCVPDSAQVVQELKRECAGRDSIGRKREGSAVAWSLQRYLIFAILACIPGPPALP
jgi:hypothetical protein